MTSYVVKAGDTAPAPRIRCGTTDQPANLTGATVVMHIQGHDQAIGCTIVDPADGTIRPSRDALPAVPAGRTYTTFQAEVEVTYSTGQIETFPSAGYLTLTVWTDLDPAA